MYLVKTPQFIQNLFPNFIWKIPGGEKVIYLTFDDGPIPEVTPWVLDTLRAYHAKGTFFCVGDNIRKNPEVLKAVQAEGHSVGSHSYHHLNGWNTDNIRYFHDVRQGARAAKTEFFRPPYGRLTRRQALFLQRHYDIIMWDVLSADFDTQLSGEQCFQNVIAHTQPGSIIVFHDSLKAEAQLKYALPKVLEHFGSKGYRFDPITREAIEGGTHIRHSA
ncbi:MAG: polysaccharide deacetylase family protein [Saprospirales bacterium]|nr:polysaccharide deacetylase family protein [Saprospirales bacterium]